MEKRLFRLLNYFVRQLETPIKQRMILFSHKQNLRLFLLHNQEMVTKFHLVQYLNGNTSANPGPSMGVYIDTIVTHSGHRGHRDVY